MKTSPTSSPTHNTFQNHALYKTEPSLSPFHLTNTNTYHPPGPPTSTSRMPQTKRKSDYDTSDPFVASESNSPPASTAASFRPLKRSKQSKSTSSERTDRTQTDNEGNPYWPLSNTRRVTVSEFKGKKMVSVREYYEKDSQWLPGKKGITMTLEQYTELMKVLPQIEVALGKEGEKVGRPVYDEQEDGSERGVKKEEEDDSDDDGNGVRNGGGRRDLKSNIEATSDEDEDDD